MKFKFAGNQCTDGKFMYKGVDLMAFQEQWRDYRENDNRIELYIKDRYGQTFFQPYIYELEIEDKKLIFASAEITNGVWGFALPEE